MCPLSSSTVNWVLGKSSLTVPSTSSFSFLDIFLFNGADAFGVVLGDESPFSFEFGAIRFWKHAIVSDVQHSLYPILRPFYETASRDFRQFRYALMIPVAVQSPPYFRILKSLFLFAGRFFSYSRFDRGYNICIDFAVVRGF